jgi:hypothetical protein
MAFCRSSSGKDLDASAITTALSPAKTKSNIIIDPNAIKNCTDKISISISL